MAVWTPELKINQPAATHWFHPHPHGNTAKQVYGGLAGMMIVSDGGDRERGLPETYGIDDLPIVLQDKRFGRNGELVYAPSMMDLMHGFQGDTLLVNGAIAPVAKVPAGFVRLRFLNAANARNFDLRFSDRRPFYVIGSDAGLLPEPVEVRSLVIAPAERYEVLVNFAGGQPVDLVTAPDTHHGMGPGMMMRMAPARRPGVTETFMRFNPDPGLKAAVTRLPRQLATLAAPDVKSAVEWRTFVLDPMMGMGPGMMGMMAMGSAGMGRPSDRGYERRRSRPCRRGPDDGHQRPRFRHAPDRCHDQARHIGNLGNSLGRHGASVPHARRELPHPEQQRKAPSPAQSGWKDVVLVEELAEILVRFDHPASAKMPFMYHCHILEHEDHGMMGQFAVV